MPISLVASLIFFASAQASSVRCNRLDAQIRDIREISQTYDVATDVRLFREDLEACGLPLEKFITEAELTSLLAKGQRAELARRWEEIGASNKAHKRRDLETIEDFARKNSLATPEFEKRLALERRAFEDRVVAETARLETEIKDSCKGPDLADKLPPVRDQDSIGWCYAFVAADLLSFHQGEEVSAFDAALSYNAQKYENDLRWSAGVPAARSTDEGGYIGVAAREALEKGYCLEKDLPSFINNGSDLKTAVTAIDFLAADRDLARNTTLVCDIHGQLKSLFPNVSVDEFKDIIAKTGRQQVLQTLANRSCRRKKPRPFEQREIYYPNVNFDLRTELQKSLAEKRPVGISVNLKGILNKQEDAHHAMLVTGQEINPATGECDFIVRNSWGNVCAPFNLSRVRCDKGILRIPAKTMAEITSSTSELVP